MAPSLGSKAGRGPHRVKPLPNRCLILLVLLALLPLAATAGQRGDPARACDAAARRAAQATGVPLVLLRAITRVETGRGSGADPWPWAMNEAGQGHWFDTAALAHDHVAGAIAEGRSNIDIGCFQLNHRWHGAGFTSLDQMFDPEANALYAARFLAELARETGDWRAAVAAFHSRTPDLAERYLTRFDAVLAGLGATDDPPATPAPVSPRENRFPLLLAGVPAGAASLVPAGTGGRPLFDPAR